MRLWTVDKIQSSLQKAATSKPPVSHSQAQQQPQRTVQQPPITASHPPQQLPLQQQPPRPQMPMQQQHQRPPQHVMPTTPRWESPLCQYA